MFSACAGYPAPFARPRFTAVLPLLASAAILTLPSPAGATRTGRRAAFPNVTGSYYGTMRTPVGGYSTVELLLVSQHGRRIAGRIRFIGLDRAVPLRGTVSRRGRIRMKGRLHRGNQRLALSLDCDCGSRPGFSGEMVSGTYFLKGCYGFVDPALRGWGMLEAAGAGGSKTEPQMHADERG